MYSFDSLYHYSISSTDLVNGYRNLVNGNMLQDISWTCNFDMHFQPFPFHQPQFRPKPILIYDPNLLIILGFHFHSLLNSIMLIYIPALIFHAKINLGRNRERLKMH